MSFWELLMNALTRLLTPLPRFLPQGSILHPFLVSLGVAVLLLPGSGYRHLWQDEMETAERARAICETGLPRTIDSAGQPSINTAGREIEDGDLHRYSPWGQFYWGAIGLCTLPHLGVSRDAALRAPFILSHAAASGLVYAALQVGSGVSPALSLAVSAAYAFSTPRLLHNRTARYHGGLELFFVVALFALGKIRKTPRHRGWFWTFCIALFLLPQCHTLGGATLAATLGALFIWIHLWDGKPLRELFSRNSGLGWVIASGTVSFACILVLSRPWAQAAWGSWTAEKNRSWKPSFEVAHSFIPAEVLLISFLFRRKWKWALLTVIGWAIPIGIISQLDAFSFSQTRYYLNITSLFLLWPYLLIGDDFKVLGRLRYSHVLLTILLTNHVSPKTAFQGLRGVFFDNAQAWASWTGAPAERQPLNEAVDLLRKFTKPGDPILIDYVPQFVNWYLPGRTVAMVPDSSARTPLNMNHPVWQRPKAIPEWHLWYPRHYYGFWTCSGHCDFTEEPNPTDPNRYRLTWDQGRQSQDMCIVRTWSTTLWNNAPFRGYDAEALTPAGGANAVLVLARKCP